MTTHPATIGFYLSRISSLQKAALIIDESARITLDMMQLQRLSQFDTMFETRAWQVWWAAREPERQDAVFWLTGASDNPRITR